jgi:hypothetical protein
MITLATTATGLAAASIIAWAFILVRDCQEKAANREFKRQRRIARAERLAMAGKRRARVIRSEAAANAAMAKEAVQ